MGASEFLGVRVQKGSVLRQRVPVAELADGTPVTLPLIVIGGERDGPMLYLQAGIHGDEVTGIEIVTRACRGISPRDLRGTVAAVPIVNVPAYLSRTRGFALEERGPIDMNRIFPGSSTGLLTERLAHTTFHELLLKADFAMDFHTALAGCNISPFIYVRPDDNESGTLAVRETMARAFGTELLYYMPRGSKLGTSNIEQSFGIQADLRGIPAITAEMGESRQITWDFVEIGVRGVGNVLKALKMVDGDLPPQKRQRRFTRVMPVHANRGGMLHMKAQLGQEVRAGDSIATVHDPFGDPIEDIRVQETGILLRLMTMTPIYPGAEIAWLVN